MINRSGKSRVIEGPDFVWLHLPHCNGEGTDRALRARWGADTRFLFDRIGPANPACHDTLADRHLRDPGFALAGRQVVCNIARLPVWAAAHRRAEADLPSPDSVLRRYDTPGVDLWLRAEHLAHDLQQVFGLTPAEAEIATAGHPPGGELFDIAEEDDLVALYAANPRWTDLELRLYGSLAAPARYQKVA